MVDVRNYKCLDVSRYQGHINWELAYADGVRSAILKTVSTNSSFGGIYIDPEFEYNYAECKRLGIAVGAYFYTYAQSMQYANAELNKFREAIADKSFEMPLVVDVEDNSLRPLTADALTDIIIYELDTIQSWGGFRTLYTYMSYKNTELNMSRLTKYDLWIRYYPTTYTKERPPVTCGMWQYKSSGTVKGVAGNVDMNFVYKDYPNIIANAGLNDFTNKVPTTTYFSNEPTQLILGYADADSLKKIAAYIEMIGGIQCAPEKSGFLVTSKVSKGDQVKIIKQCSILYIPVAEYVVTEFKPEDDELVAAKAKIEQLERTITSMEAALDEREAYKEKRMFRISELETAIETISKVASRAMK